MINENSMLSIKQFSELSGVAVSTLRYYNKIGLFNPASRGDNNYRFYLPFQVISLNFIAVLVEIGVPLTTIKTMVKDRTPEEVLGLLLEREHQIDIELHKLQNAYSLIHTFQNNIQQGLRADETQVALTRRNDTKIILGGLNKWDNCETFYETFAAYCKAMKEEGGDLSYPVGGYFDSMDVYAKNPNHPTRFFSLNPKGMSKIGYGNYLTCYERGYYGNTKSAPEMLRNYASSEGLILDGPVYVTYVLDEVSVKEPNQYLAQIITPFSKHRTKPN